MDSSVGTGVSALVAICQTEEKMSLRCAFDDN